DRIAKDVNRAAEFSKQLRVVGLDFWLDEAPPRPDALVEVCGAADGVKIGIGVVTDHSVGAGDRRRDRDRPAKLFHLMRLGGFESEGLGPNWPLTFKDVRGPLP